MSPKSINIGTLNVRGLQTEQSKEDLANDMDKYNIQILAVQETHLKGTGTITIRSSNRKTYKLYYTSKEDNNYHGVGIVISNDMVAGFDRLNDRTCFMRTQLDNKK